MRNLLVLLVAAAASGAVLLPKTEWTELENLVPAVYYKQIISTDDLYNSPSFFHQVINIALKNLRLFVQTLYARQNYLNHYVSCSCPDGLVDTDILPHLWGYNVDSQTSIEGLTKIQSEGLLLSRKMSNAVEEIGMKCPLAGQCLAKYDDKFMDLIAGREDSMILESIWQQYLPHYYPKVFQPLNAYEMVRPFEQYFGKFLKQFSSTPYTFTSDPHSYTGYEIYNPYDSTYSGVQTKFLAHPTSYHMFQPNNLNVINYDRYHNYYPHESFGYKFPVRPFPSRSYSVDDFFGVSPYTSYGAFNKYFDMGNNAFFPYGYHGVSGDFADTTFNMGKYGLPFKNPIYHKKTKPAVVAATFDERPTHSGFSRFPSLELMDEEVSKPIVTSSVPVTKTVLTPSKFLLKNTHEMPLSIHPLFARSVESSTSEKAVEPISDSTVDTSSPTVDNSSQTIDIFSIPSVDTPTLTRGGLIKY